MSLIYRYRKATDYNISAFKNDKINGSLYKAFENAGELNFDISKDILKKYGVTEEQRHHLVEIIINNCRDNYYLASFTFNKPKINREEWKKYTDNNGFCLVYDYEAVESKIRYDIQYNKRILEFKKVSYSNTPYELGPFVVPMFKRLKGFDFSSDTIVDSHCFDCLYNRKLGKYIVNSFFHKGTKYRKYNEVRIVLQIANKTQNPLWTDNIITLPPVGIIFGEFLDDTKRRELTEIAKKKNISIIEM